MLHKYYNVYEPKSQKYYYCSKDKNTTQDATYENDREKRTIMIPATFSIFIISYFLYFVYFHTIFGFYYIQKTIIGLQTEMPKEFYSGHDSMI